MTTDLLERVRPAAVEVRQGVIDSDIHPSPRRDEDFLCYLSQRWREHYLSYGDPHIGPYVGRNAFPRYMPATARRDAWPPNGGPPGSDLDFMREQHLDRNNIAIGVLEPLGYGHSTRNVEFGSAVCSAINQWQLAEFAEKESRLKASITIHADDALEAVAEIDRRAPDPHFAQVQMPSTTSEPAGRRRYWPIYEAAEHHGFPIGMHVGGPSGARPAGGWPSYYNEEHFALTTTMQSQVASLVLEGVFDRFPGLKFIMIEGGCAWTVPLERRLDKLWPRLRSEVPDLQRAPSEYMREHIYFSTQPVEEPDDPRHLPLLYEDIGWERMLYASDYPHWDFDDPVYAFKAPIPDDKKQMLLRENALGLYRLR
jgi:predicted TIM-barrel fold metal-dependent hydrolase